MNEIFKCVVPKIESANNARFIKIGRGKLSLTHVDFVKDEDSLMTGYTELHRGDAGNPWWKATEDEQIEGASSRIELRPLLIAIHHNVKHGNGPSTNPRHYCYQYATKITKEIVGYIQKECEKDRACTDITFKRRGKENRRGQIDIKW